MANSLFQKFGQPSPQNNSVNMIMRIMQSNNPIQEVDNLYQNGEIPKEQRDYIINGLQSGPQQIMQNYMNSGAIQQGPLGQMMQMTQMFRQLLGK